MHVSVCTVARGSSLDEILFPCQIEASTAIIRLELEEVAHTLPVKRDRQLRKKTNEKEDMQSGRHEF